MNAIPEALSEAAVLELLRLVAGTLDQVADGADYNAVIEKNGAMARVTEALAVLEKRERARQLVDAFDAYWGSGRPVMPTHPLARLARLAAEYESIGRSQRTGEDRRVQVLEEFTSAMAKVMEQIPEKDLRGLAAGSQAAEKLLVAFRSWESAKPPVAQKTRSQGKPRPR